MLINDFKTIMKKIIKKMKRQFPKPTIEQIGNY